MNIFYTFQFLYIWLHQCYHMRQCIVLLNLESTDIEPFCQKQHFTILAFSMPYYYSTV